MLLSVYVVRELSGEHCFHGLCLAGACTAGTGMEGVVDKDITVYTEDLLAFSALVHLETKQRKGLKSE